MVLPRLYLLRESALEIFFNNFKNTFFNFTPLDDETAQISWNANDGGKGKTPASGSGSASAKSKNNPKLRSGREQRNEVYKLLCSLCPEMQFELSPGRRLVKSGIMKKWQRGEISNFDYLMHLNTVAGRSYNDINQYPVFPWVLTDYKSASIDLQDPAVYRDLAKPIGALNEDRFEIYSERFQTFDDPEIPGFMYGQERNQTSWAVRQPSAASECRSRCFAHPSHVSSCAQSQAHTILPRALRSTTCSVWSPSPALLCLCRAAISTWPTVCSTRSAARGTCRSPTWAT